MKNLKRGGGLRGSFPTKEMANKKRKTSLVHSDNVVERGRDSYYTEFVATPFTNFHFFAEIKLCYCALFF